jgi:rSAM/selenodomain-associated transferase 2
VVTLSIVVPVLNEAQALPQVLSALAAQGLDGVEVVVADGGSTDGTPALAEQGGARLVAAPRGRARQMNAGAAVAQGRHLLFLHADTLLPPGALATVRQVLQAAEAQGQPAWGRFDVCIAGRHPMLRVIAWFMNRRSRLTGIATGDQALFMTRATWARVGGFPDQPLMEDIELSARLKRLAPPHCLALRVTTSGRRWEQRGLWRTMALMWRLRLAYWLGASPERLARQYR